MFSTRFLAIALMTASFGIALLLWERYRRRRMRNHIETASINLTRNLVDDEETSVDDCMSATSKGPANITELLSPSSSIKTNKAHCTQDSTGYEQSPLLATPSVFDGKIVCAVLNEVQPLNIYATNVVEGELQSAEEETVVLLYNHPSATITDVELLHQGVTTAFNDAHVVKNISGPATAYPLIPSEPADGNTFCSVSGEVNLQTTDQEEREVKRAVQALLLEMGRDFSLSPTNVTDLPETSITSNIDSTAHESFSPLKTPQLVDGSTVRAVSVLHNNYATAESESTMPSSLEGLMIELGIKESSLTTDVADQPEASITGIIERQAYETISEFSSPQRHGDDNTVCVSSFDIKLLNNYACEESESAMPSSLEELLIELGIEQSTSTTDVTDLPDAAVTGIIDGQGHESFAPFNVPHFLEGNTVCAASVDLELQINYETEECERPMPSSLEELLLELGIEPSVIADP